MKPVVRFVGSALFYNNFWNKPIAKVYALNHPRLGAGVVYTTEIIDKISEDHFETLNTIYKSETRNSGEAPVSQQTGETSNLCSC